MNADPTKGLILDYPRVSSVALGKMISNIPRRIALTLSAGGVIWALLLLLVGLAGAEKVLWMFLPGFAVWVGWIVRAFAERPTLLMKRLIWVLSTIYNGYWLFRMLSSRANEPIAYTIWWMAATLLGFMALVLERDPYEKRREA